MERSAKQESSEPAAHHSSVSEVAGNCVQFISTSQINHSYCSHSAKHRWGGGNSLFSLPPSVTQCLSWLGWRTCRGSSWEAASREVSHTPCLNSADQQWLHSESSSTSSRWGEHSCWCWHVAGLMEWWQTAGNAQDALGNRDWVKNFRLTGTSQMKGQSIEDVEFFLYKQFVDPFTASCYNGHQSPGFWKTLMGRLQASRLTLFLLVNEAEWIHRSFFMEELSFFLSFFPNYMVSECSAQQPQASDNTALYIFPRPGGHWWL